MTATSNEIVCECQHCGGRIAFDAEHIGTRINCPHCGLQTILGASAPKSAEPPPMQIPAHKIKKRRPFGWWSLLEILGWLVVLPSGFLLMGGIFAVFIDKDKATGILGSILVAVPFLFGCLLLKIAQHTSTVYLCGGCGNKLSAPEARICSTCHATLR